MICTECGNQIIIHGCSPICLVCQHTGRGNIVLEPKPVQQPEEVQMRGLAAGLDAIYAALSTVHKPEEDLTPEERFIEAQVMLRHRVRFPGHNRERPDLEDERERQEVCQSCNGTGRWMNRHCPDCYEPDERE